MKKIFLILTLFFIPAAYSFSQSVKLQHELIIRLSGFEKSASLHSITEELEMIKGVDAVAYCTDFKCLMLRISGTSDEKDREIFNHLKKSGIEFYKKEGAGIQQVLESCSRILTAETGWQ